MRVLEDLKIGQSVRNMVKGFNSLPDRAKEIMFASMNRLAMLDDNSLKTYWYIIMGDYLDCESPIEKILYVAMDFVYILREKEFENWNFMVFPQAEVEHKSKTYRVDFMVSMEKYEDKIQDVIQKDIVVECDGHEFHQKTKEQVKHDNEREMQIKLAGYDVLRFSGTQIYENPMKCANDIIDYALTKIRRAGDLIG